MKNDLIYIDSREQDRANRFAKFITEYLERNNGKTKKIGEMKPINELRKKGKPFYKITELKYGDYIYNNVIIEFKNWEDFKQSNTGEVHLNHQIEAMVTQTNYKDKVLIVECNDYYPDYSNWNHYNNAEYYKSIARYGGKINCNVVRNEHEAFKLIAYLFRLNADHIDRSPTDAVKKKSWIASIIYTSRVFSYNQAKQIVHNARISTFPQLLELFSKDTNYLREALGVRGVTEKKIDEFKKMLKGEMLL